MRYITAASVAVDELEKNDPEEFARRIKALEDAYATGQFGKPDQSIRETLGIQLDGERSRERLAAEKAAKDAVLREQALGAIQTAVSGVTPVMKRHAVKILDELEAAGWTLRRADR